MPTASSSARSWEISSTAPSNAWSASSSASRLSRSRWLVGSSRISTLAPEATRIASDSRRRSPPESPSSGFSAVLAGEQEAARAARAPCPASGRSRAGRPRAPCPLAGRALGVLGEVAELDVVAACAACPPSSSRWPASVSISVVLPDAVGRRRATRARRARATARRRSSSVASPGTSMRPSSSSNTTRPERSGGSKEKRERCAVARVAARPSRSILSSFFTPRLRLARLGRLVAEALDEALHPRDLAPAGCSIARPSASSRAACSLRQACQGPRRSAPRPASSSSTEVPTASRNQRSWATRTTAASSVDEVALEPLERLDVEVVGRLVEQQQVGVAGQRAGQRGARQLAAGEGRERRSRCSSPKPRPCSGGDRRRRASGSRRRARAAPARAA